MWDHAADGLVEDTRGRTEMEGTASGWVESGDLSEVGMVLDCRWPNGLLVCVFSFHTGFSFAFLRGGNKRTLSTEELARDVERLASDNDDLLAVQELLRDRAGKTTEQVSLAINDNLKETRISCQPVLVPPKHMLQLHRATAVSKLNRSGRTTGSKVDIFSRNLLQRVDVGKRDRKVGRGR